MIVKIVDKPRSQHVNPPLIPGHVYQELDSKGYYFAGRITVSEGPIIIFLFSLDDGKAWSSKGGYGVNCTARFIDVTDNSTFTVEI